MRLIFLLTFCFFASLSYTQITNDHCRDAIEVFDGDAVRVDFGDSRYDYVPSNSCDVSSSNENVWFKIVGTGNIIRLSLCEGNSHRIRVFEGGCSGLTCLDYVQSVATYTDECGGSYAQTATFYGELGKTYYIYCSTSIFYRDVTLRVQMIPPVENNTCQTASKISIASTITYSITGTFSSGFIPCESTRPSGPDAWYTFQGTGGLVKILSSTSRFYPSVYKGDCEHFKCLPEIWINEETAYETEVGETYYLQLLFSDLDEETFSLQPVNIVENDDCENAIPLVAGDTLLATFVDTKEDIDACNPSHRAGGYDIWYQFTGNDSIFHFYPNGQSIAYRVILGDCEAWECQTESLTRFIPTNGYSLKTERGKNYFLNLYKTRGADTVEVYTEFTAVVENDTYHDAIPINCLDTARGTLLHAQHDRAINGKEDPSVWYTFEGTGDFHVVNAAFTGEGSGGRPQLSYFKKENDQLIDADIYSNGYLYFEAGVTYYINAVSNYRANPFWLKLDCFPKPFNDLCSTATIITPTDTVAGSFEYASATEDLSCNLHNNGDVWYQIRGDGKFYNIGLVTDRRSYYGASFYKGDCQNLECVGTSRIQLEADEHYYLKIYSDNYRWTENDTFKIYFEELFIAENDICNTATPLSCGSMITDSLDHAIANDINCEGASGSRGIWYRLEGTGDYYSIAINVYRKSDGYSSSGRHYFTLFEGDCGDLNCIEDRSNYQEDNLTFFAEIGKTYYLVYHHTESYFINLNVQCIDYLDNDSYTNAFPIECNIQYTGYVHDQTYETFDKCYSNNIKNDIWFKMEGNGQYVTCHSQNVRSVYKLDEDGPYCYRASINSKVFLEEGITYYFRCVPSDLEEDYLKSFDFELVCGEPLPNSNCMGAIELNCGDSLQISTIYADRELEAPECETATYYSNLYVTWYKITGDDSWREIYVVGGTFKLYEGSCNELSCRTATTRFFVEAGVDYYIRVYNDYNSDTEMNIFVRCVALPDNDLCDQAQNIACGDTLNFDFNYVNACSEAGDCVGGNSRKKVWYNVTGNDEYIRLSLSSSRYSSIDRDLAIEIYENGCCYKDRPENLYGSTQDTYFYAEKDSVYLVGVSYKNSAYYQAYYDLIVDCISAEARTFNVCQDAHPLSANQTYSANLANSIGYNNYHYPENNKPVHWVQFEGTGGVDTLSIDYSNSEISSVDLYLYLDLGKNCELINIQNSFEQHSLANTQKASFAISTLENIRYLVGIHSTSAADTSQNVRIALKPVEPLKACELVFQDPFELEYGYTKPIPLDILGASGEFEVYLHEHDDKSEVKHFQKIEVGEAFNIMPLSSGTSVVEYSGIACYGHALLDLKVNNIPPPAPDPCLEQAVICETFIQHQDEELLDAAYQALKIESNAIIAYEAEVVYLAETEILLLPGFETEDESDFTADIEACDLAENNQNEVVENRTASKASPTPNLQLSLAPNPFSGQTTVTYQIHERSELSLLLYNARGQLIRTIVPMQIQETGIYDQVITDDGIEAGLYYLIFQTGKQRMNKKLVVMK
ncbi:MAG: T9SS type A sorting domain-containing protein [Bacteroidota bacterium]